MSWASTIGSRLIGLFRHERLERELNDEVRFHLEMQIEDNMKAGMNPTEARSAAMRSFGGLEPMKETYRDRRSFVVVETIAQDIRYALRTLRKSPAFTVTSVVVLALAIGANTAMFSALHALLFQPLPYRSPDQLVMLWSEIPNQGVHEARSAYRSFEDWRNLSRSFSDMAVFDPASATLTSGEPEHISITRMSPNFLSLLGVQPIEGRSFTEEEAGQRRRLALIAYRFWKTRFGGSAQAIGATVELDGVPFQVIGILPEDFNFPQLRSDVWVPLTSSPDWDEQRRASGSGPWFVIGRLRGGTTLPQAQAEMSAIAHHLDEIRGISVVPLSLLAIGLKARLALWLLTGAVFFVLLIAASNVASLTLARGASREKEIVLRAALGASRLRIVRQLLAESLTLAVMSGALGLAVAWSGIRIIVATRPADLSRIDHLGLDPVALVSAFALCLLTGILVGLAPAITAASKNVRGGRSIAGSITTRRIRRSLVVIEFALAIVLLVGAGLLIRSLRSVENVDLGFKPERVLSVQLASPTSWPVLQRADFYTRVLEQIESIPGVQSAGVIGDLFVGGSPEQILSVEGDSRSEAEHLRIRTDEVSAGLFKTIGTPLRQGRLFSGEDGPNAPRVAVINSAMARIVWAGRDPIGRRFKLGAVDSNSPWITVVGIVGDMRRQALESEPIPQIFEPLAQSPSRLTTLLIRTSLEDPMAMMEPVKAAVHRVDPHAPVYAATTLENRIGGFLSQRRFQTSLLTGFSLVALLMAAIGIYGLIQYSIATRTQEIGIRLAIGAQQGTIFRMIIGEGLKLSLAGLVLGVGGALLLGQAGSSLLFGVATADPLTFAVVSLLLTAVATMACYFPARRAMKVDPIIALRQE